MVMQNLRQNNTMRKLTAALIGAAVGIAVFLWLYGTMTLDVTRDAWIINGYDETDIMQHYAGWVLFRNSHWAFPLGYCDVLASPDGTMISYTDSLPWVSIFLKLFRGILPSTFQWFGWYILFCFAMQGAAGALLCTRNRSVNGAVYGIQAALCGLLFCCLPILWERAFRHVALTSQYLILFSLYFYLEYRAALSRGKRPRWAFVFALLPFAAVGIHPYFLPPVMLCVLLAGVELWRTAHRPLAGAGLFATGLLTALAGGLITGALGSGVEISRYGYGEISMNLNALINPSSRGGYTWSRLLPQQPQATGQYDGFNYLGLGVLILVAVALLYSLWHSVRCPATVKSWWKRNAPLFAVCVFLSLFAVTNNITLGNWSVSIPIPQALTDLCGIFRSSGRMFYLVTVCMVLFGVSTLQDACDRFQDHVAGKAGFCLMLAVFCGIQIWDLSLVAGEKQAMFERPDPEHTVTTDYETQQIGIGNTKLMAACQLREDRVRELAILAGKQGLATNISIAVSGSYPQAEASMQEAADLLQDGSYDSQTVYVTTDEAQYLLWKERFGNDPAVGMCIVNSCYFLVPLHTVP